MWGSRRGERSQQGLRFAFRHSEFTYGKYFTMLSFLLTADGTKKFQKRENMNYMRLQGCTIFCVQGIHCLYIFLRKHLRDVRRALGHRRLARVNTLERFTCL